MKTMTCDDAFEALTGPGEFSAADLERHLAGCARCREMSEVLAPALALFEGVAPTEPACFDDRGTAGAHSQTGTAIPRLLSPAAVRAADDAAKQLAGRSVRPRVRFSLRGTLRVAVVFVLGVATAFAVAELRSDRNVGAPAGSANDGSCLWVAADSRPGGTLDAEQVILSCVVCHLPASAR